MNNSVLPFLILSAAVFTSGCITSSTPLTLEGSSLVLREGDIVDTEKKAIISFDALMDELQKVRVIYIGEFHTSPDNHRMRQRILEALQRKNPSFIIGMEMFPRKVQPVLDRWTGGDLSEERFRREADWEKNWGYPYRLYRSLLAFSRDHRIKLFGLNAPSEVVKKIARKGLTGLSPSELSLIAGDMDMDNPDYREHLRAVYDAHAKGKIRDFDTFLLSQLAWDETMAESIAALLVGDVSEERIVALMGNGHINYHFGVPLRALRRVPHSYKTVVSIASTTSERKIDRKMGDYILVIKNPRAPHGKAIGVMIHPGSSGQGLKILHVFPGSRAEKAGIRKGDLFLKINGAGVADLADLHHAMAGKGPVHDILIRRDTVELTIRLEMDGK